MAKWRPDAFTQKPSKLRYALGAQLMSTAVQSVFYSELSVWHGLRGQGPAVTSSSVMSKQNEGSMPITPTWVQGPSCAHARRNKHFLRTTCHPLVEESTNLAASDVLC